MSQSGLVRVSASRWLPKTHGWAAEISHAAGFALEIINAGKDDGAEKVTFAAQDMQILQGLLIEIREAGHKAFLRARGSEKSYQSLRAKAGERLGIPERFQGERVGR